MDELATGVVLGLIVGLTIGSWIRRDTLLKAEQRGHRKGSDAMYRTMKENKHEQSR